MIKHDAPHCDICGAELKHAPDQETHYAEDEQHGFFWRHASKHYCEDCSDKLMEKVGYPPCDECRTQPCTRGHDCWATPPLHLFPYETFWSTPAERCSCGASLMPWMKEGLL